MDKDLSAQPELLSCVGKLRDVFEACDPDSDGFILPEHLVQLGQRFGSTEQVS